MDNNIEKKSNAPVEMTPLKKLEIFKDEISRTKEVEMNKKRAWEERGRTGEAYNPHFDHINPEYLGQAEREVYEKYKNDDLSVNSFNELKKSEMKKYQELSMSDINGQEERKTIVDFWAYMGNLVQAREGRRQVEELKRKKKNQAF